ncbi:MAG: DUF447 family protein [Pseudomonadota bacterium]|nr:DUF447 family protein [Pseudomonadota bacterium]
MIRETVVTTVSAAGKVHVAPFGLIEEAGGWVIAPFRPSVTLDNLLAVPFLVANYVADVRVIAGCLTGRRDWPCLASCVVPPPRLAAALAHAELEVASIEDDATRPRFHCRVVDLHTHAPFRGFNRAQGAVLEAAILVSRLGMLPREKVEREIAYLQIAVDKTAGPQELEAWQWLMEAVTAFHGRDPAANPLPQGEGVDSEVR